MKANVFVSTMPSSSSQILKTFVDGKPAQSETLIPMNHLQQMALFMLRQGLLWKPKQDTPAEERSAFLYALLKNNQMDLYYEGICDLYNVTGGILWYLHPTQNGYQILWFHSGEENGTVEGIPSEYKVYSDASGKINEVIVRYSYEDYSVPIYTMTGTGRTRWVRLRIKAELIKEERFEGRPDLDPYNNYTATQTGLGPVSTKDYINTYGVIPCAESKNKPTKKGKSGVGDFHHLGMPIEADDALRSTMLSNVYMFDSPTFLTSRPREDVLTQMSANSDTALTSKSWAESQGFNSGKGMRHLTNRLSGQDSSWGDKQKGRIAPVIGNVEKDELYMYLTPDPISPDFFRFADDYRENLHGALGGLDPYGPHSGATVLEIKSLSGKIAAVAKRKANALFTHGLGAILQLAIETEEKLFVETFTRAMLRADPKVDPTLITRELITQMVFEQGIRPDGIQGLPPYGTTEVVWRWAGPVFEDTPRDKLDNSIVARNMQELGMNSLAALGALFPDLDESEKRRMLSGIPFRLSNELINVLNQMLGLYQGFLNIPDITLPPDKASGTPPPLGISFCPQLKDLMGKVIQALQQEYSYGQEFRSADTNFESQTNVASSLSTTGGTAGSANATTPGGTTNPDGSIAPTESESTALLFDWANPPVLPGSANRNPGLPGGQYANGSSTWLNDLPRATNATGAGGV